MRLLKLSSNGACHLSNTQAMGDIASLLDDVKKIAGHQFSLKRLSTGEWGINHTVSERKWMT